MRGTPTEADKGTVRMARWLFAMCHYRRQMRAAPSLDAYAVAFAGYAVAQARAIGEASL